MSEEVCDFHSNGGWFDPTKECYICKQVAQQAERIDALETALKSVAYYGLDNVCEEVRGIAKAELLGSKLDD